MYIDWKKTLIVVCDIVVATYLLLAVTTNPMRRSAIAKR